MMASRSLPLVLTLVAIGCGARPTVEETTPPPSEEPAAEASVAAPALAQEEEVAQLSEPAPTFEALLAELEEDEREPWPTLANATRACPAPRDRSEDGLGEWYEGCEIPGMAAWDARAHRWIVLDVDRSEGGIERVSVIAVTAAADETLLTGELSPAFVAQLRTLLRGLRASSSTNLVTGGARQMFSLGEYPTVVSLGGPLAGSHLWLQTSTDLDHPEHVLFRVDGSTRVELGRRAAQLGPCDGDGWYCEAHPDEDCTPAELRAEHRLCVPPVGIEGVSIADGTLVVVGTVAVAGHGGYPPFHWVVPFTQ